LKLTTTASEREEAQLNEMTEHLSFLSFWRLSQRVRERERKVSRWTDNRFINNL
jgi:hypothetical protein